MVNLYIFADKRLFKICRVEKNNLSYSLKPEQCKKLVQLFENSGVPYRIGVIFGRVLENCSIEEPAKNKIIFEHDGEKFHILNYNSYLIHNNYATRISAALNRKNIKSHVETSV